MNHHMPYFRWGKMKTEKLPDDFDLNQVRRARPLLVDEPLFSSSVSAVNVNDDHSQHETTTPKTSDKSFFASSSSTTTTTTTTSSKTHVKQSQTYANGW